MIRKTIMWVLTLVLALGVAAPLFAQEAAPASPTVVDAAQPVYLPLVNTGQSTRAAAESTIGAAEDLTDGGDRVEAAGGPDRGLVFVATNANDPLRGNEIVMYRRASDGSLTLTGRFPTAGQGLGGGLGSQNALVLSKNGRWLFVVNAGSNEISVFEVFPAGLILADKVASGGVRPTSLTVRQNLLYVLNAGGAGNITGFKLGQAGELTPLAASTRPLSNNGAGAAPAPAQVSFTPDGTALVVTERATNLIDLYPLNRQGQPAEPVVHNSAGVTPFGFAFGRGDALIVSEAFGGAPNGSAVSSYLVAGADLRLVSGSAPTGETAACWIVIAGDGKYAYSTNAGSASLSLYEVGIEGDLTLLNGRAGDTGPGTGPTDPAVSRNGRWLYALSTRSQTVIAFAVQGDGSLVSIGSFAGLPPNAAGIAAW